MIQPMATWRLVLLELIVAAVLAAAAAAEQTCQPVEAFDPQNTVKPLQLPVADILVDIAAAVAAASVVSAGAVVDIAEKDEAAAAAAAAVSPSLRELPRWNKSQIHQMDWMEGRMIP